MRDLLNDLDAGLRKAREDPAGRAREQMRQPLPRRFYGKVTTDRIEDGWVVLLDGRPAKTPGRTTIKLPTAAAADLLAGEFDAQKDVLDLPAMPVLRLVNTTIDGVAADPQAVIEDVLRFASCDLVCYRADAPEGLVARQAEAWDPVVDWARCALSARMVLAEGVMHVDQPREALAAIGVHVGNRGEPFRLAALHVMTALTGSALIALAVEAGEMTPQAAWDAAHVDEDWNISQWGEDAETALRRATRHRDMLAAAALIRTLD